MLEQLKKQTEDHMHKTLDALHVELSGIRTGKANPTLLDSVRVDYFGQAVPLKQVASVAAPDPKQITVQPWDRSLIVAIEKAIQSADLGLNPQNDGMLIRIPIPPLTEERRKDMVKVVRRIGEESKVALRNIRRDANDRLKKLEKEHEISEDAMHSEQDEIQKLTDAYTARVDESLAGKEKEIMAI